MWGVFELVLQQDIMGNLGLVKLQTQFAHDAQQLVMMITHIHANAQLVQVAQRAQQLPHFDFAHVLGIPTVQSQNTQLLQVPKTAEGEYLNPNAVDEIYMKLLQLRYFV
jgi:hypothetical protein